MKTYKIFSLSYLMSNMSSSILYAAIPLIIYFETKSPILLAIQFLITSAGSFLASVIIKKNNLFRTDRNNLILNELLLSVILFSFFIFKIKSLYFIYLICFIDSFFSTMRAGYNESIIGDLSNEEDNRQKIIGFLKSIGNIGTIMGYMLSPVLIGNLQIWYVFVIPSILLSLGAIIIYFTKSKNLNIKRNDNKIGMFSVMFSGNLRYLSISHGINAISLGIFNSTIIFFLKDFYKLSDFEVSAFMSLSMICSLFGSIFITVVTRKGKFNPENSYKLRAIYFIVFLALSIVEEKYTFIMLAMIFNLVHYFSIPIWQDMFQENSKSNQWKMVGASRKTLVSICLMIGSVIGGIASSNVTIHMVYIISSILTFISMVLLIIFIKKVYRNKSIYE